MCRTSGTQEPATETPERTGASGGGGGGQGRGAAVRGGAGGRGRGDQAGGSDDGGAGGGGGGGGGSGGGRGGEGDGGGAETQASVSCAALSILGLLTAFPPLTMEIYIPSLPTIQSEFHTTAAHVLSTLSVYTVPGMSKVPPQPRHRSLPWPPGADCPGYWLRHAPRTSRWALGTSR